MASVNNVKAAVLQLSVSSNDKASNFLVSERVIREAVASGCELIVLQELHATSYFCQQERVEFFDFAESLDGETFCAYEVLAAELNIVLVISQFERRAAGLYHNTAQVIDADNGRAGIFRKMHIPDDPGFYEKFYFTPGDADGELSGFKPVQTRLGKLGVLVCWDQWYPEAARLMTLAGADLLIYPTAIGWDLRDDVEERDRQLDAWITVQRAHAVANGVPVLVANRTGFEVDPDNAEQGIQFWGNSFIVGPQGEYLAKASSDEQVFLSADIDMARAEEVRRIWPYLRDRRVDAYQGITKRWLADKEL